MSTKLIEYIYKDKDKDIYKDMWRDFLNGVDVSNSFFGAIVEQSFENFLELLKIRWISCNDDIFYDASVHGCWKIVTFNGLSVIKPHYCFRSNDSLDVVRKALKDYFSETTKWDIPTKDELLKITGLENAPFSTNARRPRIGSDCALYSLDNKVHGFNIDRGYLSNADKGHAIPLLRLPHKNNRELFYKFVINKLIPNKLQDKLYKVLIEIEDLESKLELGKETVVFEQHIIDNLLNEDKRRADISAYDIKMLEDTEQGHWSLWQNKDDFKEPLTIKLSKKLVARDPKSSVNDGIVGIDFGTKSTVVVYQKDTTKIHPMRVGTGDLTKVIDRSHYENPTIMEFNDIKRFVSSYEEHEQRPYTKWSDLTISHAAYNSLKGSASEKFNTFLDELKQWAGDKNRKLKIIDKQGEVIDLPPFLKLKDDDINPIEIYAYYLGLYINNQNNGIFLNYTLSFPVTYEVSIQEKIIESFQKGIKKSLPAQLQKDEIDKLNIDAGASEPAAYAIVALQEYGFDPCDDEKIFYGVFDFGGGTTDFDFGIFRESSGAKERRYDYVIEHFGAEGDRYLGGENLLELLAFKVFKKNKEKLLKNSIQFEKHPEKDYFAGSEKLLSFSQEAKMNTKTLSEHLRAFWEGDEDKKELYENGVLGVNLVDVNGQTHANFELDIDSSELKSILMNRISKGVLNFFQSLRLAFSHKNINLKDIEKINIFLAGNSSKSEIVKNLFAVYIELEEKYMKQSEIFKIYEPLGATSDDVEKPTGKTGVAFGLIHSRDGGDIKVINHNITSNKEIRFKYYLGESRKKKFKTLIDRETPYNKWIDFIDASIDRFEIYYTTEPSVSMNNVSISDSGIKKLMLKIDTTDDEALVYIRVVKPTVIEYVVALEDEITNNKYLSEIKSITLS